MWPLSWDNLKKKKKRYSLSFLWYGIIHSSNWKNIADDVHIRHLQPSLRRPLTTTSLSCYNPLPPRTRFGECTILWQHVLDLPQPAQQCRIDILPLLSGAFQAAYFSSIWCHCSSAPQRLFSALQGIQHSSDAFSWVDWPRKIYV